MGPAASSAAPKRSLLPWILGGVIVIGVAAGGLWLFTRDDGGASTPDTVAGGTVAATQPPEIAPPETTPPETTPPETTPPETTPPETAPPETAPPETTPPETTPPETTPPETTPPETTPPETTPPALPVLQSGLFCRDVADAGYWYGEAVAYWVREGRPDRMDADLNGIPCETVFPPDDIDIYYGSVSDIEPDLFCRDLNAAGWFFSDALAYWVLNGTPDRMDADLNGTPCETVYPADEIDWIINFDSFALQEYAVLQSGLLCRDVADAGYWYGDAVAYWVREGRPARMDADVDGIPCETVFPPEDIDVYYGLVSDIEPDLLCRDLQAAGWFFYDALAYWVLNDAPDRMDADLNGIPCQTVYPADEIDWIINFDQF